MISFVLATLLCVTVTLFFIYKVRFHVSRQPYITQIITLVMTAVSFFFAFSIPIMLPLDIYGDDTEIYTNFWAVNYWVSQILSWVIIPLFMELRDAPEFHLFEKLRTGLRTFFSTNILAMFVLLIFIVTVMSTEGLTSNSMKTILVSASNTFGLIVVIIALGYGLVGVLHSMYRKTNRNAELKSIYVYIGACKNKIKTVTTELQKLKDKLDGLQTGSLYDEYINCMLDALPPTLDDTPNVNISTAWYDELVHINKGIKTHMKDYNAYNNQMHLYVKKVISLKKDTPWNVTIKPHLFTFLLIGCSMLSFIICWSEITIPTHNTMLPNSIPVSSLFLSYMAFCTYYTYTQIYVDWRRDLLYSSMIVGRFAVTIGLNYISILYSSSEAQNIRYYNIYETFSYYDTFSIYYPILTIIFAVCGAFNIIERLKHRDNMANTENIFEQEGELLVNNEHKYMTESII